MSTTITLLAMLDIRLRFVVGSVRSCSVQNIQGLSHFPVRKASFLVDYKTKRYERQIIYF